MQLGKQFDRGMETIPCRKLFAKTYIYSTLDTLCEYVTGWSAHAAQVGFKYPPCASAAVGGGGKIPRKEARRRRRRRSKGCAYVSISTYDMT